MVREIACPGVREGDRRVDGLSGEERTDGPTDRHPAANHNHVESIPRNPMALNKIDDGSRGARERCHNSSCGSKHESPEIRRVEPIGVFRRIDSLQQSVGVEVSGQGQLDDVTRDRGIGVELVDNRFNLGLSCVFGQLTSNRRNSYFGTVLMLATDVPLGTWVVADEHGCQAGDDSAFCQTGYSLCEVDLDGGGCRRAVKNLRRHPTLTERGRDTAGSVRSRLSRAPAIPRCRGSA
ncbi:unannotated protein [freshwater metagenome]|uniref:Unannotated protein n=1 Tax=freshwater metagenome TaxID=449393 RepID=A0A6J6GA49_9ZZZZ